jgi:hypothetical protein
MALSQCDGVPVPGAVLRKNLENSSAQTGADVSYSIATTSPFVFFDIPEDIMKQS